MKVYLVYKITRDKTGEVMLHPFLYGYTTKKSIIKEFENQRNMKHFAILSREFTKNEYMLFDRDNRHMYLDIRRYDTYIKDEAGHFKDYIEIVSTEYEEEQTYVKADSALFEVGKFTDYPLYIFNEEIVKSLKILQYNVIRDFRSDYHYNAQADLMFPVVNIGKKSSDIRVDTFYIFMFLFGNTMKK